jgi:hypothetical protein
VTAAFRETGCLCCKLLLQEVTRLRCCREAVGQGPDAGQMHDLAVLHIKPGAIL